MELELEAKALINETEYKHLLNKYPINETVIQTNYYFETKDEYFKNLHSALRVREKYNKYELTLKIRTPQGSIEHNFPIEKEIFDSMLQTKKLPKVIKHLIEDDLFLDQLDIIKTTRSSFDYLDHIVEVDYNDFDVATDFEIEIESDSIKLAKSTMNSLLKENNIPFQKSTTKIARCKKYKSKK